MHKNGVNEPCDAKFSKKCLCSNLNNINIKKQISLIDTTLVMKNNYGFNSTI